jgi:hypothetical protein
MSYRKSIDSSSVVFTQAGAGAAASTVEAKLGETLSILDFGATGDGVTDDSTAIQSALDALQKGDTLLFPDGLYLLGTGLTLSVSGVTLRGSNSTGTADGTDYGKGPILIANSAALNILTLSAYTGTYTSIYTSIGTSPSSGLAASNVTVDGLQFICMPQPHTGICIDGILAGSLTVQNCTFTRVNMAIEGAADFFGNMGNTFISGNTFEECSTGSSPVITVGRVPCFITNNSFYRNTGMDIGRSTSGDPDSCNISDNIFWNEGTTPVISTTGASTGGTWIISNNVILGASGAFTGSIDMVGQTDWIISGNQINNGFVIDIDSTSVDGLIFGNIMVNTGTSDDSIRCGGDRVSILNNHIQSNRGTDLIKLEAASSLCVVGGNTFMNTAGALIAVATAIDDLGTTNELADLTVRGDLDVDGALTANAGDLVNTMGVATIGTTGSITTEDLANATTGGITITLPAAATAGTGKVIHIKDRDASATANPITIEGDGSETIDGSLTFVITVNYQSVTLVSDGSNWMII